MLTLRMQQQTSQSAGLCCGEERREKHLLNLPSVHTLSIAYPVTLTAQLDRSHGS